MSEETMNILIENLSLKDYTKVTKDISKLKQENQQLKKQKDDVIEYIKKIKTFDYFRDNKNLVDLLRMLGEIDVEDKKI